MCDTIGKIINRSYAIFGKNSDRAINEPQVIEYYPSKDYDIGSKVKCTYIEIDQVEHTNSIVISRPTWIWGAEIGVNEYGVCIGNEALFTKGKYGEQSLIGMDYLRLALERGSTAREALDVIIQLLNIYGQGGSCGYDSDFHYNNSYLIMDRNEIYVLETVGNDYSYKKQDNYAISNAISIREDGDQYKNEKINFKKKYSNPFMTFGASANRRRNMSMAQKIDGLKDMIKLLSSHSDHAHPFTKGCCGSICMHAANSLLSNQTTMSMIVELKDGAINIWTTGCSLPCSSLFIPHQFKPNGLISMPKEDGSANDYFWKEREIFHRELVGKVIPAELDDDKKKLQKDFIIMAYNGITDEITEKALRTEKGFFNKWKDYNYHKARMSFTLKKFMNIKNKEFEEKNK